MVDVEVPGGSRFEHHVIRAPNPAAGVVVVRGSDEVLLLWRHRFITDTWGWEIPAGSAAPDEPVEAAAAREVLEETGWQPSELTPLIAYHPMNGISDATFHLFLARGAAYRGVPTDVSESERVGWVPIDDVRASIRNHEITDGLSLTALTYALATGVLG
jgi:8-oxo-dGTP pyrophosphatase MutT (NUDIX family)